MPSQFTSQIKIVPDQEQQHISIGLESLSRNLTKIQALKNMDDQAKMDQFNKLVDVSLEDFWQRDKDELYQGEQDYLASVAQAYKDYGKEGILPYQYQSKLDKEKSELMMKLEQSKADAEWYKSYMKQVAWDKTGKVDIEESTRPLTEWMKLPISERAKIDKSQWFKLKAEEINLVKEIGEASNTWLKEYQSDKLVFDDDENIKWKETYKGVSPKSTNRMAENIKRNERWMKALTKGWEEPAVQQKYPTFDDYVKSHIPYQPGTKTISGFKTGPGKGGYSPYKKDESGKYSYAPTTDKMGETPGDSASKEGNVTSLTSVSVQESWTYHGKAYNVETVKVLPTAKSKIATAFPGSFLSGGWTKQKKGDFIFDENLQDNADNIEYQPYVVISHIKEKTVRVDPSSDYNLKTKVVKTKVYETIPYDEDVKSFLIKSKKFGKEADDYISGILNQVSGGVSIEDKSGRGGYYTVD